MGSEKVKPASAKGDSSRFNQTAKSSPKQQGLIKCGFTSRCSKASVSTLILVSLSFISKLDLTQAASRKLTLPAGLLCGKTRTAQAKESDRGVPCGTQMPRGPTRGCECLRTMHQAPYSKRSMQSTEYRKGQRTSEVSIIDVEKTSRRRLL